MIISQQIYFIISNLGYLLKLIIMAGCNYFLKFMGSIIHVGKGKYVMPN